MIFSYTPYSMTMSFPSIHAAVAEDLYSDLDDLKKKYPPATANKIIRVREMHQHLIAHPAAQDRRLVDMIVARYKVSRQTAYDDIRVLRYVLPAIGQAGKEYHRERFVLMILGTFEAAQRRGDIRTMERAAATYARYLSIDKEDDLLPDLDMIVPQPFVATDDPSVLGIKPIPGAREKIRRMIDSYVREVADIEDISFEAVDLEEDELFDFTISPEAGRIEADADA